jgi:hypothetical protein
LAPHWIEEEGKAVFTFDPTSGHRETELMYAVVSTVRIEDLRVARRALGDMRLNLVPRAPGFVNAYRLAPVDGIGMSVIVFDTKEHADQAAAYPVRPLPRRHAADSGRPRGIRQGLTPRHGAVS